IVAATVELLQHHGIAGLSVEEVARRANVAKATVYRRWPTKQDLVLAVLARVRGPVPELPADLPVRDALVRLLTTAAGDHHDPARGNLLLRRLIGEFEAQPDLARDYLTRVIGPRREHLLDLLRRGIREGVIRVDADLELAAEALFAPILLGTWIPFGPRIRAARVPDLVDLILAGLAPPP
ncbi:MAG TPA: TetR/AcrR family transcriptional regulator, partial [Kineosporiaceae bacterium]|nr:TetR/AcrR family transcriptional regulator [Kineosporiaceae bacterium]